MSAGVDEGHGQDLSLGCPSDPFPAAESQPWTKEPLALCPARKGQPGACKEERRACEPAMPFPKDPKLDYRYQTLPRFFLDGYSRHRGLPHCWGGGGGGGVAAGDTPSSESPGRELQRWTSANLEKVEGKPLPGSERTRDSKEGNCCSTSWAPEGVSSLLLPPSLDKALVFGELAFSHCLGVEYGPRG